MREWKTVCDTKTVDRAYLYDNSLVTVLKYHFY